MTDSKAEGRPPGSKYIILNTRSKVDRYNRKYNRKMKLGDAVRARRSGTEPDVLKKMDAITFKRWREKIEPELTYSADRIAELERELQGERAKFRRLALYAKEVCRARSKVQETQKRPHQSNRGWPLV